MNNKIDSAYTLHNLWGSVISKLKSIKRRYLILPIIYLLVIVLFQSNYEIYSNNIVYHNYDSYLEFVLDKNGKIDYILEKYNLSRNEFNTLTAICLSEAQAGSYEDAYAVINTIYNRTHSKNWVRSVNSYFGNGKGNNLYYQAISPNQFVVYQSGSYKGHLNDTNSVGYNAIIDFLYTEKVMHDYLSFRAYSIKVNGSESFAKNGNNYFNKIKDENRI